MPPRKPNSSALQSTSSSKKNHVEADLHKDEENPEDVPKTRKKHPYLGEILAVDPKDKTRKRYLCILCTNNQLPKPPLPNGKIPDPEPIIGQFYYVKKHLESKMHIGF